MKRVLSVLVAVTVAAAVWSSVRAADSRTKEAMREKLDSAQKVLEGIALENYDLIAFNAQKLKALSQSAGWQYRQTAEYQRHTADFARQAEALIKAAERKNLDGATVAYFQLTASCVACHRHLRGSEQAKLDLSRQPQ
jgi:cytochrome c556